jgi:hypothetical protein
VSNPVKVGFTPWPKIARLNKDMVITEKIDGTNAALNIRPLSEFIYQKDTFFNGHDSTEPEIMDGVIGTANSDKWGTRHGIAAQSRNRILTVDSDNFGFAKWVEDNFVTLIDDLGPGLHFGEWWGLGIQRGYGLDHKRFSLFNVKKWEPVKYGFTTPGLDVVPTLRIRTFDSREVNWALDSLRDQGSYAAPGFMNPEGVVVYHTASGTMYKAFVENDDTPKSQQ